MTPGVHLVRKEVGETSFEVVQRFMVRIKKEHPGKKLPVCHGGTLDPFATGLLLLLVGQTTRLMDHFHPIPKRYLATVRWGVETDNGDLLGMPVAEGDVSRFSPRAAEEALTGSLGWQEQVPPFTSAKKIGGEPAYKKAHRGEVFEMPPSRVFLHEARFLSHGEGTSVLELSCKGGYYVRSLARDLGRAVGVYAHLEALERTAIGPYPCPPSGEEGVIRGTELLSWLPFRVVDDDEARQLAAGANIATGAVEAPHWPLPSGFPIPPGGQVRAIHRSRLVALLAPADGGGFRAEANLRGGL